MGYGVLSADYSDPTGSDLMHISSGNHMEYLDIVDEAGQPTGKIIPRNEAHQHGIRHRTAHVWIVRKNTCGYEILLQKRSEEKESYPGMFDTSSAGHIPAGCEPLDSALRELSEELGIVASPDQLNYAGSFRIQYEKEFHGRVFRDNEFTSVYVYEQPVDISALTLQESEVSEVRWFDLEDVWNEIHRSRERFCVPTGGLKVLKDYLAGAASGGCGMNAKRGYVPEDEKNFSPSALGIMRTASRHIDYLINEGYDLKQASTFVGNHFLLSERQRLAIMRSLATKEQVDSRQKKEKAAGKEVWIDGFNTIITLEVMLSNSILFFCMDGTIRDLAALRGTYRIIPETADAVRMLFDALVEMNVESVHILLDEPVSNSGRLKALIADIGEGYPINLDIQICKDVDRALYEKECVISSDSIILDYCRSWINLMAKCLEKLDRQALRVWE